MTGLQRSSSGEDDELTRLVGTAERDLAARGARSTGDWDRSYAQRHVWLAPVTPFGAYFSCFTDWPRVADWDRAYRSGPSFARAPVRFVATTPRPRRRRGHTADAVDVDALYDARIVRGEVPSRERSWHDFLNAHVWATFPESKRTLHERQLAMMRERIDRSRPQLPAHRTPEQDAVAMLDEGGVVLLVPHELRASVDAAFSERRHDDVLRSVERGQVVLLVFGHGIMETWVVAPQPIEAIAIVVEQPADLPIVGGSSPPVHPEMLRSVDAALAMMLADRACFRSPRERPTLRLPRAAHVP